MADAVEYTKEGEIAIARLRRGHGNAINGDVLAGLMNACTAAEEDPEVRGMMLAGAGKLFCPGLDLPELIRCDRVTLTRFIERFNACILTLYAFPKPMLAAIHGHAIAGGCVLTLTADWRMLCRGALVGLNEVRVGVPFPFGVAMILREAVGHPRLEEVALFGRNYRDEQALETGLVHELHPSEGFDGVCRERLGELAAKDARAFAITKRYLRSATVERIRANDAEFQHEFLDAWFSPGTQQRVRAVVEELERKKG